MLIEDGNRLYLVSEDPKVKDMMRQIESQIGNECVKLNLEPSATSTSSEMVDDVSAIIKSIQADYNANDMSKIMMRFDNLMSEANTYQKTVKEKELKKAIHQYLIWVDNSPWNSRERLLRMYTQIRSFIKPVYIQMLQQMGYAKFEYFVKDRNANFDMAYSDVIAALFKRVT